MVKNPNALLVLCLLTSVISTAVPQQAKAQSATGATRNLVQTIEVIPTFGVLTAAIKATDLTITLNQLDLYTVFAPSNTAFQTLPSNTRDNLLADKKSLTNFLRSHTVFGRYMLKDLEDGQRLKTLSGQELIVTKANGKIMLNGVPITHPNVTATNGVVHVLDAMLTSPDALEQEEPTATQ